MVRTLIAAAALFLTALTPGIAFAGWEWTSWGMSREQVIAGSGGRVKPVQGVEGQRVHGWDLRAAGPVDYDGFSFNGEFYFDPDGRSLKVVRLMLKDVGQCQRLQDRMAERYGPPQVKDIVLSPTFAVTVRVWPDNGRGDLVGVTANPAMGSVPAECFLRSHPAAGAN